ncbi:ADP-ribose glycohydrolase MACROD2 [Acropora cervicornis]|uniref:ADP-ribose glycohydrolase MACROD2 n=1 Tax=Acropora cervicornis TaxID=6130 RepID=A0AAD9QH74_ACRCE|nr:ADP-ribose glycohydrolase MACROD2 [Acropora cervicornis]
MKMEEQTGGKRKAEALENSEPEISERKSPWSKFDKMPLDEKRELYRCGKDFVTLDSILKWSEYLRENVHTIFRKKRDKKTEKPSFEVNEGLNEKISLWRGDITTLEIDGIVNAVDGCIHRAAGSTLKEECKRLNGCQTGEAKITSGHKLPAKYVIHTVGPIGKQEKELRSCYSECLNLVTKYNLRSVVMYFFTILYTQAFCCVSTGIYGYPIYDATSVALETVRRWLELKDEKGNKNADLVDRIIFCIFLEEDLDVYQLLLLKYFPSEESVEQQSHQQEMDVTEPNQAKGNDDDKPTEEKGGRKSGVFLRFVLWIVQKFRQFFRWFV